MASDPEDLIKAEQVQRERGQQVRRGRLLVRRGRELFMFVQAGAASKSGIR